jgi:hypothetical protein
MTRLYYNSKCPKPYGVPKENEDIRDQGHHAFSCSRQRPPAADPVLSGTDGVPPFPDSPLPAATGTRRPPESRAQALGTTFPLATDGLKGIAVERSRAAGLPLLETAVLVVSSLGNGTSLSERATEGKQRRSSILPVVNAS